MQITATVERLLCFAQARGMVEPKDVRLARNALLFALRTESPMAPGADLASEPLPDTATPMLALLCDAAVAQGFVKDSPFYRDQFSAHLMNLLTPPPSRVVERFARVEAAEGVRAATDWFYALCQSNDYIRVDQIKRNEAFSAQTPFGEMEITINLSKPEKDPREIAALKNKASVEYPQCMLCIENEGYAGRLGYPSHETLRMVPISVGGTSWYLQYSPYSYYPEHCIALNAEHVPMKIGRATFTGLMETTDRFPHYFFGSNADLPIVGGSILTHNHFQGGRHVFPMDKAKAYAAFTHREFPGTRIEAVRWPMTCIRMRGGDRDALAELSDRVLTTWRTYDDPSRQVLHETNGEPHNTITPIARRGEDGEYTLHLVLRNNRTTKEFSLGIFHPHDDLHHIKKENIGLIEVMGLFILPGRLKAELNGLSRVLTGDRALESIGEGDPLYPHRPWMEDVTRQHGTALSQAGAEQVLRDELTVKCVHVLEDAGVFKPCMEGDAALARFLAAAGIQRAKPPGPARILPPNARSAGEVQ